MIEDACPSCTGLGTRMEVDPELVVSDPDKTLAEGAIALFGEKYEKDVRVLRLGEAAQVADHHEDVLVHGVDVEEVVLHLTDDAAEHR